MNYRQLCMVVAAASVTLVGCNGSHHTPEASTPPSGPPTDFSSFVNQQVLQSQQPGSSVAPASTSSLTTDLALGEAAAFGSVNFGKGDSVPAGTHQAVVACAQAGQTACNPSVSADLNSNLN